MEQKVILRIVDDIVIIDSPKEMTMTYSNNLYVEILKVYNKNKYNVIFNMEKTKYISSFGISILIIAMRNARENNGEVKLAMLSDSVKKMIDSMDFQTLFEVYPSVQAALKAFKEKNKPEK